MLNISEIRKDTDNSKTKLGGNFSRYMLINTFLEGVWGSSLQDEMRKGNIECNESYDKDGLSHRRKWINERLSEMRRMRAEQDFASHVIQLNKQEVEAFIEEYLPICKNAVQPLITLAEDYRINGYSQDNCPLQILLLHTKHTELNKYEAVYDYLDNLKGQIHNVEFPRWCEENAEQNVSILNLHAIMKNIPTAIISPYYHSSTNKMLFTIAMWEAQANSKPLIVPVFSLDCVPESFDDNKKKNELVNIISRVCALLSGCVRDIYMLYAFASKPTLPLVIDENKELANLLMDDRMSELKEFIINEYAMAAKSLNMQCDNLKSIALFASEAQSFLLGIFN